MVALSAYTTHDRAQQVHATERDEEGENNLTFSGDKRDRKNISI